MENVKDDNRNERRYCRGSTCENPEGYRME